MYFGINHKNGEFFDQKTKIKEGCYGTDNAEQKLCHKLYFALTVNRMACFSDYMRAFLASLNMT